MLCCYSATMCKYSRVDIHELNTMCLLGNNTSEPGNDNTNPATLGLDTISALNLSTYIWYRICLSEEYVYQA